MRYFYEPTTSDTESEGGASVAGSSRSARLLRPVPQDGAGSRDKGKGKAREEQEQAAVGSSSGSGSKSKGKQRERPAFARNRLLSPSSPTTSSSSSSDSNDNSDSDSDDDDDDAPDAVSAILSSEEGSDSEEDEFPVNPSQAEARRRLNKYSAHHDPLEVYHTKQQQRAWERAQAAHHRDLAALRTIRLNAFAKAQDTQRQTAEDELEHVRLVLEDFDLRRQREEEQVDRQFKERNSARWDEINRAISRLEDQEREVQENRRKQEEAEQKARKLREEEEARIEREKQESEKRRAEEEKEKEKAQAAQQTAAAAADERAKKEKEDRAKAVPTAVAAPASALGTGPPKGPASDNAGQILMDSKAQFERWHAKIQEIKSTVLPAVSGNPSLKKACWQLKRTLSTRISNVSASAADIQATAQAIHTSLADAKQNPQAYLWCLNLLSKKIIEMAGNNNEPDLSPVTYALAQVVVALLCADHAEFADIFMARLVKRCPYVVPFYPARGQTPVPEYNKLIGRKESEQNVNYRQRMSGIVSLYAAIVQTAPTTVPHLTAPAPRTEQLVPAYFRPEGGWRWLSLILRAPLPLLDTTPLLIHTFLRMAAERFHQLFGRQFIKLLQALAEQGLDAKLIKWNEGVQGDLSKIRLMIQDWMDTGRIKGAEGRVPT